MIPRETVDIITQTLWKYNASQCNIHAVNPTFVKLVVSVINSHGTGLYSEVRFVTVGQVFTLLCPPPVWIWALKSSESGRGFFLQSSLKHCPHFTTNCVL